MQMVELFNSKALGIYGSGGFGREIYDTAVRSNEINKTFSDFTVVGESHLVIGIGPIHTAKLFTTFSVLLPIFVQHFSFLCENSQSLNTSIIV